jgi:hypothetical protein
MNKTNQIDCFKCRHFYVTWQQNFPRGCRAFEFKTQRIPSEVILESSGSPCLKFELKTDNKNKPSAQKTLINKYFLINP